MAIKAELIRLNICKNSIKLLDIILILCYNYGIFKLKEQKMWRINGNYWHKQKYSYDEASERKIKWLL